MAMPRLLRIKEVKHVTGMSKTTIYRKMAEGTFPAALRLAPQTVAWLETDLQKWVESLQADPSNLTHA